MTKRSQSLAVISSADHRRACATIAWLISNAFFNIGTEPQAKCGSFGVATLKVQHITWLGPNHVRVRYSWRDGIKWDRIVHLDNVIAKALYYFMKNKGPYDRVFPVRPVHVNAYLSQFDRGKYHYTAKDFRTATVFRYLESYLHFLDEARVEQNLTPKELKQIFRGVSLKKQNESKRRLVAIARSTARKVVKQMRPRIEIPAHLLSPKGKFSSNTHSNYAVGVVPFLCALVNIKYLALRNYYLDTKIIQRHCRRWGWEKRAAEELL